MATQYLPSQKRKPINLHKLEHNWAQESDAQRYDFFSLKEHIRRIAEEDTPSQKSAQVTASRERLQRQKTKTERDAVETHEKQRHRQEVHSPAPAASEALSDCGCTSRRTSLGSKS